MSTFRVSSSDPSKVVDGMATDATRADRLKALEKATTKYITAERKRLNDEVAALKAILEGRTGGKAIQSVAANYVGAVARKDLKSFLES
jgi:hypothetical protein